MSYILKNHRLPSPYLVGILNRVEPQTTADISKAKRFHTAWYAMSYRDIHLHLLEGFTVAPSTSSELGFGLAIPVKEKQT